jgi:hypothetical protein
LLSDVQGDWPERTFRNPDGSPLLAAAALRGWFNVLWLGIERTTYRIHPFFESLDEMLRGQFLGSLIQPKDPGSSLTSSSLTKP